MLNINYPEPKNRKMSERFPPCNYEEIDGYKSLSLDTTIRLGKNQNFLSEVQAPNHKELRIQLEIDQID